MGWTLLGIILKSLETWKAVIQGVSGKDQKGGQPFNVGSHSVIRKSDIPLKEMLKWDFFSLVIHNFMSWGLFELEAVSLSLTEKKKKPNKDKFLQNMKQPGYEGVWNEESVMMIDVTDLYKCSKSHPPSKTHKFPKGREFK